MYLGLIMALLALAYVLFGIAPAYIKTIQDLSPFTISFFRFTGAAVLELIVIFIFLELQRKKILKHRSTNSPIPSNLKPLPFIKKTFQQFLGYHNPYFQKDRRYFWYIAPLGLLLSGISVPTLYFSYNLVGVVITTIFINCLAIISIALLNWFKKEEEMDGLKIIYLSLLLAAVFTVAYSSNQLESIKIDLEGILILFLAVITYTTFIIQIGRDQGFLKQMRLFSYWKDRRNDEEGTPPSSTESISFQIVKKPENNDNRMEVVIKSMMKLFFLHVSGIILIIPLCYIFLLIGFDTQISIMSDQFLHQDLPQFFTLLFQKEILELIVLGTLVPYFLIIITAALWPKEAMKHDLWTGVFSLLDPLLGMYIGYFLWGENIKLDYILFTTLFLVATIVLRYFHTVSNTHHVIFLIKIQRGRSDEILTQLQQIKEIDKISFLTGYKDILVELTLRSLKKLSEISDIVKKLPSVADFQSILIQKKY